MKAVIRCTNATGEPTGELTIDIDYGRPIRVALDDLPRRTRVITVDYITPNGLLAGIDPSDGR